MITAMRGQGAAVAALSLVLACSGNPSASVLAPIDLTEDLHHRMAAGILNFDYEPLVLDWTSNSRRHWEYAVFTAEVGEIRVQRRGVPVVVYFDEIARWSHIQLSGWPTDLGVTRFFPHNPIHPLLAKE